MFLLCLVAEKKVAWILFFVKFSDFYGMAVNPYRFLAHTDPGQSHFTGKAQTKAIKKVFREFLHQLIAHCPGKKVILILDNASIHVCRYIKEFVGKNPNIEIFTLPTYFPEYNPTE